jgi:hypothetical protein
MVTFYVCLVIVMLAHKVYEIVQILITRWVAQFSRKLKKLIPRGPKFEKPLDQNLLIISKKLQQL